MIVVRNVFRLKFGKAREAAEIWKDGLAFAKKEKFGIAPARLLTDLAGSNFYTIVFETTHESLADYENAAKKMLGNAEWKNWYAKFVPLVESGHREIFNIAG